MKILSITTVFRLVLLTVTLLFFFACSSSTNKEAAENSKQDYWTVPTQYQNVPIEEIKAQVEITEYKTIKGAATRAERDLVEKIKNTTAKTDEEALATFVNKLVTFEGEIDKVARQAKAPLAIEEIAPGKYQMWFCDKTRTPCRYAMFLLYEGEPGKGNTLFSSDNTVRFWGIIRGEEIRKMFGASLSPNYKRYPKIRVLDLEVIK